MGPIEQHETNRTDFVVLDIENKPDGSVMDIGVSWRQNPYDLSSSVEHRVFADWNTWFAWAITQARKSARFRTYFAHNGGAWDWLALVDYLIGCADRRHLELSAVCAGSRLVTLRVKVSKQLSIQFCDSLQLLRSSLDQLADQFGVTRKRSMPYDSHGQFKLKNPTLYYEYLRADCRALLEILEKAMVLIRQNICPMESFGYTVGSTAMKLYRTFGLDRVIEIPDDDRLKGFLRRGYRGGWVDCFRVGKFDRIKAYDINSLYPTVMANHEVPYTARGYWTDEYEPEKLGIYEVTHEPTDTGPKKALVHSSEGTGVYFSPEIAEAVRTETLPANFNVVTGYVFVDTAPIFRKYVETLYRLRRRYADSPIALLCKFLLNSLYGKFGQKSERWKVVQFDSCESLADLVYSSPGNVMPMDDERGIAQLLTEKQCIHEHVGIAGVITSWARVYLFRGMQAATGEVVYCDTDSLHINHGGLPAGFVGDGLGQWKLEHTGKGAYAGKKLYALRTASGREKTRAKGVRIGGDFGASVGFDDICSIIQGEQKRCEYQTSTTPLEVFTGKRACVFNKKHRTLRVTA